jgi:mono/diheme cytochrome c family protein
MHGSPAGDLAQRILIGLQWLVLAAGIVLFVFGPSRERRFPTRRRGWIVVILGSTGLVLASVVGYVVYQFPQARFIPPSVVAQPLPPLHLAKDVSPELRALGERGRYLYAIAPCQLCHGSNGAGGGKINWRPMGTLWTRNISSNPVTGVGAWSDAELARAIRSGVSRNGYALHWQGMPWDHFSNWDEEDLRALIAFLRTLPSVNTVIPADRAPAPDDCAIYTFWLAPSTSDGCP